MATEQEQPPKKEKKGVKKLWKKVKDFFKDKPATATSAGATSTTATTAPTPSAAPVAPIAEPASKSKPYVLSYNSMQHNLANILQG